MRSSLARLFARNPLTGMTEHMQRVLECSEQLPKLVAALIAADYQAVSELARETSRLEGLADLAKNTLRQNLPRRLFLPVDRRDLLRLLSEVDAVADCAEDVGVLLTLRKLNVPAGMTALLDNLVQRVMETVRTGAALVGTLPALVAAGFGKRAVHQAQLLIDALHRQEHEADKVQDQIAKLLFQLEAEMSPVELFMWTKVLSTIGEMADHAENVGEQFYLLIAD